MSEVLPKVSGPASESGWDFRGLVVSAGWVAVVLGVVAFGFWWSGVRYLGREEPWAMDAYWSSRHTPYPDGEPGLSYRQLDRGRFVARAALACGVLSFAGLMVWRTRGRRIDRWLELAAVFGLIAGISSFGCSHPDLIPF